MDTFEMLFSDLRVTLRSASVCVKIVWTLCSHPPLGTVDKWRSDCVGRNRHGWVWSTKPRKSFFSAKLKPVKRKQRDDSSFETAECTWLPSPSLVPLFFSFACLPRPLVSPLTHCFVHLFHSVTFNQPRWCYCFWERLHYVSYTAFNRKRQSLQGDENNSLMKSDHVIEYQYR